MRNYAYPLVTMLLWSGNVIVSKMAHGLIAAPAMSFYRVVLALAIMSLFAARPVWRHWHSTRPQLPKLLFLGFLSMAFYQCLSYWAAASTSATNMAVITALTPLLTLMTTRLLLPGTGARGMLPGALIALFGTVWLISGGHPLQLLSQGVRSGDLLMLTAALSYAFYSVFLKKWHITVPAWQSTYLQAWGALITLLPVFFWLPAEQTQLNEQTVPLILYAGILASVLLPYCWIQGITRLGPARCSLFLNILPFMTAMLAIPLLGETLGAHHVSGGLLTLAGVILAQWPPHRWLFKTKPAVVE